MFKHTTRRAFAVAAALLMAVAVPQWAGAAQGVPSGWAAEDVGEARDVGLATPELLGDFAATTTRAQFCRAAVNLLRKYGYDVDSAVPKMFADTNDTDIGIAAALGITNGTDAARNLFSPNGQLTREQAATLLNNVLGVLGERAERGAVAWTDADAISSWALQSASDMYHCGVISGTDAGKLVFSPKMPYTHEQSIVTLLRMWHYLADRDGGDGGPMTDDFPPADDFPAIDDISTNTIATSGKTDEEIAVEIAAVENALIEKYIGNAEDADAVIQAATSIKLYIFAAEPIRVFQYQLTDGNILAINVSNSKITITVGGAAR
jgi:hypothetical protein